MTQHLQNPSRRLVWFEALKNLKQSLTFLSVSMSLNHTGRTNHTGNTNHASAYGLKSIFRLVIFEYCNQWVTSYLWRCKADTMHLINNEKRFLSRFKNESCFFGEMFQKSWNIMKKVWLNLYFQSTAFFSFLSRTSSMRKNFFVRKGR